MRERVSERERERERERGGGGERERDGEIPKLENYPPRSSLMNISIMDYTVKCFPSGILPFQQEGTGLNSIGLWLHVYFFSTVNLKDLLCEDGGDSIYLVLFASV